MPNGQEVVTFSGMNQDVDPRFLPDGAYVSADNFRIGLIGEGTASVQSVEGNISLELDIPANGITKCVGLFDSKAGHDDHIVVYNKDRFRVLANELGLKIVKYKTFELRCNQMIVLAKK